MKMLEEKRTGQNRNDGEIVSLDALVTKFHLLRKIDRSIDWRKIYPIAEHKYSKIGRPSVDPVVLVKMVMLQHIYGIRSLRQTVAETEAKHAFDRFFQGNISHKSNGYGIGLAISKKYANSIKGTSELNKQMKRAQYLKSLFRQEYKKT